MYTPENPRQHGTRARYVFGPYGQDRSRGCRCSECTTANRRYARDMYRARNDGTAPRMVDAAEARDHLRWLSKQGVGRRRVHEITGIAITTLYKIRRGQTNRIRPQVHEAIMLVFPSDASPGAFVPAAPTLKRIDDLLAHGFTRTRIAEMLGSTAKNPALQIRPGKVRASTAAKVLELHTRHLGDIQARRDLQADRRARYRQPGQT